MSENGWDQWSMFVRNELRSLREENKLIKDQLTNLSTHLASIDIKLATLCADFQNRTKLISIIVGAIPALIVAIYVALRIYK